MIEPSLFGHLLTRPVCLLAFVAAIAVRMRCGGGLLPLTNSFLLLQLLG
jgi:hypothetical protein